jgi:hypothetical protein
VSEVQPKALWSLVAVAAIWLAVILTSLFSPDMVTGSEQEQLKIPAVINWLWGGLATMSVLRAIKFQSGPPGAWMTVGVGTAVIWTAVTLMSIFGPVFITGTDPTRLPLAAIIAPIAGLLLTRFLIEMTFDLKDSLGEPPPRD